MPKKEILFGLMIALLLALILSPFASPWPDGLEKVAEDKGFIQKAEAKPVLTCPISDYIWPGIKNDQLATSFAGVAGTLLVFALGYSVAILLKKEQ